MKLFLTFILVASFSFAQSDLPKVFSIDAQKVFDLRNSFRKGQLAKDKSIQTLFKSADKVLDMTPVSVVEKKRLPASGDIHDYMSLAPYWWPDPNKPDGLPYIRRDGEKNPECLTVQDHENNSKMVEAVTDLALSYYLSGNTKYSEKATELIFVWFINEQTKMNPNLNFAQFISGVNDGRGAGIIDLHANAKIIDAVGLLESSSEWGNDKTTKMKNWFNEYLNWLLTSKNGIDECNVKNNHGSWYDVQVVTASLFVGKIELAKQFLENAKSKRIDNQILPDGKQPLELVRTKSMHYSLFNLDALFQLALLGDKYGIDLWNHKSKNGSSIRVALDFLLPFWNQMDKWEYKQISSVDVNELYPLLLIAKNKFDEKIYSNWIDRIHDNKIKDDIINKLR